MHYGNVTTYCLMLTAQTSMAITSRAIRVPHYLVMWKQIKYFNNWSDKTPPPSNNTCFGAVHRWTASAYPHDIDVLTARQLTARGLRCGGGSLPEHSLRLESTARHSFRTRVPVTQSSWRARWYCFRLRLRKYLSALFVSQQTKAVGSAWFCVIFLVYFGNPLTSFYILFIIFLISFPPPTKQTIWDCK